MLEFNILLDHKKRQFTFNLFKYKCVADSYCIEMIQRYGPKCITIKACLERCREIEIKYFNFYGYYEINIDRKQTFRLYDDGIELIGSPYIFKPLEQKQFQCIRNELFNIFKKLHIYKFQYPEFMPKYCRLIQLKLNQVRQNKKLFDIKIKFGTEIIKGSNYILIKHVGENTLKMYFKKKSIKCKCNAVALFNNDDDIHWRTSNTMIHLNKDFLQINDEIKIRYYGSSIPIAADFNKMLMDEPVYDHTNLWTKEKEFYKDRLLMSLIIKRPQYNRLKNCRIVFNV